MSEEKSENSLPEETPKAEPKEEKKISTPDEILESDFDLKNLKYYKLIEPVTVADKTYTELHLNFKLKGKDMEQIAALPGSTSPNSLMNEFSKTYLMHFVARAAGITYNELREFSFEDCTALTVAAQTFLLGAVSKMKGL